MPTSILRYTNQTGQQHQYSTAKPKMKFRLHKRRFYSHTGRTGTPLFSYPLLRSRVGLKKVEYSQIVRRKRKALGVRLASEFGSEASGKSLKQITDAARSLESFSV